MFLELLKKSFHPSFSAFVAMAIVIVLVGSAISVAFSVHHYRLAMQELQQLREQRNAIDIEWGQLLLEQHSWRLLTLQQTGGFIRRFIFGL